MSCREQLKLSQFEGGRNGCSDVSIFQFPRDVNNLTGGWIFKGRISTKQIGYRSITLYSLAEIRLEYATAGNIPILENIADDYTKMKHKFLVAEITGDIILDANSMTRNEFTIDICMPKRIQDTEI